MQRAARDDRPFCFGASKPCRHRQRQPTSRLDLSGDTLPPVEAEVEIGQACVDLCGQRRADVEPIAFALPARPCADATAQWCGLGAWQGMSHARLRIEKVATVLTTDPACLTIRIKSETRWQRLVVNPRRCKCGKAVRATQTDTTFRRQHHRAARNALPAQPEGRFLFVSVGGDRKTGEQRKASIDRSCQIITGDQCALAASILAFGCQCGTAAACAPEAVAIQRISPLGCRGSGGSSGGGRCETPPGPDLPLKGKSAAGQGGL